MCPETIHIAGRYNKYMRNLSQSPWIDKDDVRIKHSVQELIEDGLKQYLKFDKTVFSSSGREDVDVRMLGKGRPFVFKIVNPWDSSCFTQDTMNKVQDFINSKYKNKIEVRYLQIVTKDEVGRHLKDGEESKTKEYRALFCCSRKLTDTEIERVDKIVDHVIDQKTPIRVLHRRSLAVRKRKILRMKVDRVKLGDFESVKASDLDRVYTLTLLTEAGTYIKEFVHGDFGRTEPSLSDIIGDCDSDLMELDVMEVYLDWPKPVSENSLGLNASLDQTTDKMETSEENLSDLYSAALRSMKEAESMPRGDARQGLYMKARHLFERSALLVESLSLFSDNETIEDVSTVDLKYLLIPAYLAKIFTSAECGPNRLDTFTKAEVWIKKFFYRILRYGLGDSNMEQALIPDDLVAGIATSPDLQAAMRNRNDKIEKFKKMKLLESRLDELERRVSSGQEVDDEVMREYYLSLIKKWVEDTYESLESEVKPALFFEKNRAPGSSDTVSDTADPGPLRQVDSLKTITIVKDDLQKQVFGLGYPSAPTVTVDEFIGKKIKDGDLAFTAQKEIYANSLQRYAEQPTLMRDQEEMSDTEREEKEDRDDAEELSRKRRWDDFKDETARGSGNRHNMG